MRTLAQLTSIGLTICGFLAMTGTVSPMPQFMLNAMPFFVLALLAESAYPKENA